MVQAVACAGTAEYSHSLTTADAQVLPADERFIARRKAITLGLNYLPVKLGFHTITGVTPAA